MEDSTQNTFPWLESHFRRLVHDAFELFVKSGPASVAAFLMEDSTQNTFLWLEAPFRRLVHDAFDHFVKSGPASVDAFLMADSMPNTFPWLDSNFRTLVREAFVLFSKSGPASVAAFLIEDSSQNTSPGLESRILVPETLEHLLKSGPASSVTRREQIQELQLHFETSMPDYFFVGRKVKGHHGAICVKLIDTTTGHVVESGPLSEMTLDVVVLAGDFKNKDEDGWTWEDFKSKVKTGREGKGPLLEGDLQVPLKAGVGSLAEFKFTDISTSRRSKEFRLGVKFERGFFKGIRVREAKTAAFRVIHNKPDAVEKHAPRPLDDDVCKLFGIGKKGRENLNGIGIFKVKDFIWKLCLDPEGLRKIFPTMSNSNWKTLGDHAKESVPSGKYHVYYADDTKNSGVVFKNMSELCGLIEDGKYYWAETVSDSQKVSAHTLKKEACANWRNIEVYDSQQLLAMTDVVTGAPESCHSGIDQLVSSVFPTAPSGEAFEDFFEGLDAYFCDVDPSHLPESSWDPSEQANGTKEVSAEAHVGPFEQGESSNPQRD